SVQVDLGAGRIVRFGKLQKRASVPAALAGTYMSADSGAIWEIVPDGDKWSAAVRGPLIAGGPRWPVQGVDEDTVELTSPGNWLAVTQLAHLVRDAAGKVIALQVSTGRIKKMRFDRQA